MQLGTCKVWSVADHFPIKFYTKKVKKKISDIKMNIDDSMLNQDDDEVFLVEYDIVCTRPLSTIR